MSLPNAEHCGRWQTVVGRREFLYKAGMGCGLLALADLLAIGSSARGETSAAEGAIISATR